jgi:peroxiredoxin
MFFAGSYRGWRLASAGYGNPSPVLQRNRFMAHLAKWSSVLAMLAVVLAARGYADELKIGDAAPDFHGIIGVDDHQHSLADYKDAKLLVLVFTCNHCPVAKAYENRLVALQKRYDGKGVQFVAVNVNNLPDDRLAQMKVRAKEKEFNFPYLYDASQKLGRDYGALVTPHVFLLDQQRKIAYIGAIDDNMQPAQVKDSYLGDALDALLAGKKPPQEKTTAVGCGIRYE